MVGFLSVNPGLAYTQSEDEPMDYEEQVHNPPPSAVPRLHALLIRKVDRSIPVSVTIDEGMPCLFLLFFLIVNTDEFAKYYDRQAKILHASRLPHLRFNYL